MARPRRGTLRRRQTTQGVSYTVQFSYRGEEHYVYLGGSWEGWTEQRAVEEQGYLMAKVNRGEWRPAPREPLPAPAGAAPSFQLVPRSGCTATSSDPVTRTGARRPATICAGASRW